MTSNDPRDITECRTVSEIFGYSLPQVRQAHRNLTSELDEKNARLRKLVGGSYRQLLGTADTILNMNDVIRQAEDNLMRVSHACRKSASDDLAAGLDRLYKYQRAEKNREHLEWFARLKALDLQILTIGKLLRSNEAGDDSCNRDTPLILTVKILAISTLLLKSVEKLTDGKIQDGQRQVLDMRKKLDTLRQKLLDLIERNLNRDATSNREGIIQALTAYSLTTGSRIMHVHSYFLDLREDVIASYFAENPQVVSSGVVKAIILFARTLIDTPIIFSRGLSENLANLKVKPFLEDESIRNIEELRLDELEIWFSKNVRSYIPYIDQKDLDKTFSASLLRGWEAKISNLLIQGLSRSLECQTDLKTIVNLRNKVFQVWIEEGGNIKNFDPSTFLRGLRDIFNSCILKIIQQRCQELFLIGEEVKKTVASWEPGITDKQVSLWDQSILEMEVNNGADLFKKSIVALINGRNDAVSRVFSCYKTWRKSIDETLLIIDQMKDQKWYSDYEVVEDDVGVIARRELLNKEDPQLSQQCLHQGLQQAFKELQEEVECVLAVNESNANLGQISMYILRIIRDIRLDLPANEEIQNFGIILFDPLYDSLARTVIGDSVTLFIKAFEKKRVTGRVLWEGDPELTVQLSPAAFRLLYDLSLAIGKAGQDLWTSKAVLVLKKILSVELTCRWNETIEEKPTVGESFGDTVKDEVNVKRNEQIKDVMIQAFFDFSLILKSAFWHYGLASDPQFKNLEALIISRGELNAAMQERICDSALNYWKKTHLLFGILA